MNLAVPEVGKDCRKRDGLRWRASAAAPLAARASGTPVARMWPEPAQPASAATQQEHRMNSNQIKGAIKDATGKVRRKAGEALGSRNQELKGAAQQVAGKAQKALGDAQDAAANPRRKRGA